jgi:uncharacterized protein YtpQ (UPF0354 family)
MIWCAFDNKWADETARIVVHLLDDSSAEENVLYKKEKGKSWQVIVKIQVKKKEEAAKETAACHAVIMIISPFKKKK